MICECVLHPVQQTEATEQTDLKEQGGRRGGDLYFWRRYSHGIPGEQAAVGSPSSDGSAGETCRRGAAEDVSHTDE